MDDGDRIKRINASEVKRRATRLGSRNKKLWFHFFLFFFSPYVVRFFHLGFQKRLAKRKTVERRKSFV